MKQCLECYKTYADDSLNFCLEDGELLVSGVVAEPPLGGYREEPPTMIVNESRQTNPQNWATSGPTQGWQPGPVQQQFGNFPTQQVSRKQTLSAVSLGLGVGSLTIGWCCSLGLLLGPAALITGFIALPQIKKNPDQFTGRGLAIAGMICGALYIAIYILIIVIWGIAALSGSLG